MTMAEQVPAEGATTRELSREAAVPRSWVHRHAIAEVFVTDSARRDVDGFQVAAQLPRAHSYFGDHLTRPPALDPLLLLECGRQAGTLVAHRYLGVPLDSAFLISRWTTRLEQAALRAEDGDGPQDLLADVVVRQPRRHRDGRLLGATLDVTLHVFGRVVAGSTVWAGYPAREDYRGYRTLRRETAPPTSDGMARERPGTAVAPAAVGRRLAQNVVLAQARAEAGGVTAALDVPVSHAVLYDHPLDHVPAMALLEAARQSALLATSDGPGPGRWCVTGLDARFQRFVELDAPTTVTAGVQDDGRGGGRRTVQVDFRQSGATACTTEVTLVEHGGADA